MELEPKKNDVANKKKKKILVTWKIIGAPETSVLYIYIYIYIYTYIDYFKKSKLQTTLLKFDVSFGME